jgi:hypothetical protein
MGVKAGAPPGKVTIKGWLDTAESPPLFTLIGRKLAPAGTVTLSTVEDAVLTVAFTDPKKTVLAETLAPKPVPVMETSVPTCPDLGENELIVG